MTAFLLLSLAWANALVDLADQNYALRLAPHYLKAERPRATQSPCKVTEALAQALSRAQDVLRLNELYVRVMQCGAQGVALHFEDRAGHRLKGPPVGQVQAALAAEGIVDEGEGRYNVKR